MEKFRVHDFSHYWFILHVRPMWVKFFAQSAVLSHPISSGIPVFSDFFVQNIRAKRSSVTSGDRFPLLSLRDIFPRRGGSLSSQGELFIG